MSAFRFYHPIEVRYGDLDPQGHVNNANFLTYIEQARVSYLIHVGLFGGQEAGISWQDVGIILADAHLTFRAPILFGQRVRVGVRVTRLGNKSLTMEYCLEDGATGQEMATASTVLVTYDYHTAQTIPIPAGWRAAITRFEELNG